MTNRLRAPIGVALACLVPLATVAAAGCFVSLGETNARSSDGGDDGTSDEASGGTGSACPPVTDPSLIGWWRFEEEEGSREVRDCSGHHLDGTLAQGTVRRVPGHSGRAIDIDGKAGCFDLGLAPSLAFTTGAFTISAWTLVRTFTWDAGSSPRWFLGRAQFAGDQYHGWGAGSHPPENFELKVFPLGSVFVSVEGPMPKNQLVHVAAVRETGRARVFVGGVLAAQVDSTRTPDSLATAHARIGCRDPAEPPFDGVIDDLRVYDRALSDAEIAALAKD